MQVSLGFDERHFEKGGILEQPWKQFLASSDIPSNVAEIQDLFENVNQGAVHAPVDVPNDDLRVSDDAEVVSILEVPAVGPILKPLGTGVPAWLWVIFGILVFLLIVALSQGYYSYQTVKVIETPIVETQFFAPGNSSLDDPKFMGPQFRAPSSSDQLF